MKKFYPKKSIRNLYKITGIGAVGLLVVILVVQPFKDKNLLLNIILFGFTLLIAILEFTRLKRCCLTIDKENITFNDGMLSRTKIPLDLVSKIQYHADLKFRFKLKKYNREVKINNIFSEEDQLEILSLIQKYRHNIKIEYLTRPDKIITRTGLK